MHRSLGFEDETKIFCPQAAFKFRFACNFTLSVTGVDKIKII